jgi:uncharacterized repeat protein (TIGR01451 family)
MKKLLLLALLFCFTKTKAQYVTIPDAKFAAYLHSVIPAAMNGNQMDTTNPAVIMMTNINVENDSIGDLTGVQYFPGLQNLDCGNGSNALNQNYLTALPKLPGTLTNLVCGNNKLTSLPALPNTLWYLECYNNMLTSLPTLPDSLNQLMCYGNQLTSLPTLPAKLQMLYCYSNPLTSLPALPNSITDIDCGMSQLTSLPALPDSLYMLVCVYSQLTSLPALPNSMKILSCRYNQITSLPALPDSLQQLNCGYNSITSIPTLPSKFIGLACDNNQISNLPALPNTLKSLDCSYNNIACFQRFPDSLVTPGAGNCVINNNPFTCLPNYVPAMDASALAYPLCTLGNTNGCPAAQGIIGFTYKDMNADCSKNLGDSSLKNIPIKIYDNSNNLLGQTYSALNGVFDFPQSAGTYSVVVDTTVSTFMMQCAHPGIDSVVTVSSIDTNINFAITCKPGFDVGVQSAATGGIVFPGQQHTLYTIAGDLSQWQNLNCATGISGHVQISVTGPVTYVSPAPGALTPSVSGNSFTYTIADFSNANIATAFNLIFSTNTNAQAGDTVCVNINVTPTNGDNNPSNNNYSLCYQVENSHDPNFKETYPVNVAPAYNNWFTYTIHFQNTGSASAINIRLADTLDAKLDLSTFQLINYNHKNTVMLSHNILSFNFNNINLPDSTTNRLGSTGFVQYRIKPKANLPAGTQIKNTAYIYFDYNAAIVTNTSVNNFGTPLGIAKFNTQSTINIYPNPANNKITIDANDAVDIKLFDVLGKQIFATKENQIDVSNFNDGVYFIQVQTKQNTTTQKIMVQH